MLVVVIGAGPAGLLTGAALARRGHRVVAVDRDPGPPGDGYWPRRGVMQFHHAHTFRPQVALVLQREWPEAFDAWLAAGAELLEFDLPGRGTTPAGVLSRRDTFERALRSSVPGVDGLTVERGHAEGVTIDDGRLSGVVVDGRELRADLVVDASGRSGRAADGVRAPAQVGGLCGTAYVDRQYRLREGAEPGPLVNPLAWQGDFEGYQSLLFLHERGYFSVLLIRPTADAALKGLRHTVAFEAACRAIPGLRAWTDPARSRPVTDVHPGGPLRNAYRGQARGPAGGVLRGFLSIGDAVATTTPIFGRGVATTFMQIRHLLALIDGGTDPLVVAEPFDRWCEDQMLPWVEDHIRMDTDIVRRWQGGDINLDARLPSDLILAAAAVEPAIISALPGYITMLELPSCLDAVEPLARAVYARGWRPRHSPGPTRDELVGIVEATLRAV
jgi:2-polyprenyl-6-methoxyphenol hydroxylase-like FAD-dependent oxidoreductase